MKTTLDLGGAWRLRADGPLHSERSHLAQGIPAVVPGSVHTDLMAHGELPDPYLDLHEQVVQWVGDTTWTYSRTFEFGGDAESVHELVFEGLDTVAEVTINGSPVGSARNMHRSYRWEVSSLLVQGSNTIAVTFPPARDYGLRLREELGDRPHNYPQPYNFVRKMASNYGWDWGPDLATAGIWKPVRIESWKRARLADVAISATLSPDGTVGLLTLNARVERQGAADELTVRVSVADRVEEVTIPAATNRVQVSTSVPGAEAWWPRGLGGQHLYELVAELRDGAGPAVDEFRKRIGFRNATLTTAPDESGMSYTIGVNGVDLFIRGANWIPDDCFVARVDKQRYRERIEQAIDANINLLRVWGGGIYEKDEFYDLCDELGVLVSQDFLFACAAYPEEEPVWSEVEAEAVENIRRLSGRPSLVLWNGSNENIWGYFDWGWKEELRDRSWGLGYYTELLPQLVSRLDPHTPYWASSPYSGTMERHPNDPAYGNTHLWEVWNAVDYTHYSDAEPRFVSEFGFQGPPTWATIEQSISDRPLAADSPGMLHHQKARDGNGKLERGMAPHLPEPVDFDDWHYLTQLNQARAVAYGIEYFRSLRPKCMGAIVWQLNDCWPVTSWAAIDGYGRKKPLWYALRRVYADRLLTIQPGPDGALEVVIVNDAVEPWAGELIVRRTDRTGQTLAEIERHVEVAALGSVRIELERGLTQPNDSRTELLVARVGDLVTHKFFTEDKDFAFELADFTARASQQDGTVTLSVVAETLLRDIVINVDRVDPDAVCSEQLVTLLPGESHEFTITTEAPASDPRWVTAPVIRCVNDVADAFASGELSVREEAVR